MSISAKDSVGSRIRCLHLSGLIKDDPKILEDLVALQGVKVPADNRIIPCGEENPHELVFNKPIAKDIIEELLRRNKKTDIKDYEHFKKEIEGWWLEHPENANTPNWDIACIAEIDGIAGLILVEAKAHQDELSRETKGKSTGSEKSKANQKKIGEAIGKASEGLSDIKKGLQFDLSLSSPYQLSNRFAWAWKLASMKIPVVLVYLGFLNAKEMKKKPFRRHEDVEIRVREVCRASTKPDATVYVPDAAWSDDPLILAEGANLYSVIRSMELVIGKGRILSVNGVKY